MKRISSSLKALGTAALCVVMVPAFASADPTRVLVLPYAPLYESIPRATGEQIANTVQNGLRGKSSVALRSLPGEAAESSAKAATAEQKAAVLEAKEDLERGRGLLGRRRVKPALDTFTATIEKIRANAIALEDTKLLEEAYLRQAAALFLMGREDEAEAGPIVEALVLNPALVLDEADGYGPPFIELVEKMRQGEIAERGHGELRVDTTPPGALVWVDGREALTSPVRVSGIVPGTHYISIKLPSVDTYTEVVRIEKDSLFHISPDEGAAEGPVSTLISHLGNNQLDAEAKGQLQALAQQAEADVVLFGGTFAEGAEMGIVSFYYSVSDDTISPLVRATLNREMLGATIELNRVSTDFLEKLSAEDGEELSLPMPVAAGAKAGAESINEVDLSVNYAAYKGAAKGPSKVEPARSGPRRPVGGPRAPIGTPQKPAGGGARPELGQATPTMEETPEPQVAQAPEPEEDFLDFSDFREPEPEPEPSQMPAYTYSGGIGIEDEVPISDEPQVRKAGLLNQWWFWTGAAIVVGGAVGAGVAMSGGGDGVSGNASW